MKETLYSRIVGQDEAVVAVIRAIVQALVGLKSYSRPIARFIFFGSTGVKKQSWIKKQDVETNQEHD